MARLREVTIYTDGACLGNPGPGGYGTVLLYGSQRREISGGYCLTTNNRMEIMAVIAALEALTEPCRATVYSDSQYVVNAITQGWAQHWKANGWKRNRREDAVNPDLWERLLGLCDQHQVEFRWLRGHSGIKENERCDRLAVAAAKETDLPDDPGYHAAP